MNDLRLRIVDATGHAVVSNLDDACSRCFSGATTSAECHCPAGKGTRRIGKHRDRERREFFACMQGGKKQHRFDITMSTLAESFALLASHATEPEGKRVARLIHDISGVLGRNHFFALVPQHKLMDAKYQDQLDVVRDIQRAKPDDVCKTLIDLHRDNQIMAHLFTIYRILDCGDRTGFDKRPHKLHSLLLNVLYLWRSDFDEKKMHIHAEQSETKVLCDFNTVQAAFVLFLDNVFKYGQAQSDIRITFDQTGELCNLRFAMSSLHLKPEERATIFESGRRGELAIRRKDLPGQGIGMGRIRGLMVLNGGVFDVAWGNKAGPSDYVHNEFVFRYPLVKSGRRH